jgi:hypothetical protein
MGTSVHPAIKDAVFNPEEARALAIAFDDICHAMHLPDTATVAREVVATRVIDLAREGLLDPALLSARVLHEARAARRVL